MIVANVTNRPAQGLILAYPTPVSRGYVTCIYYAVSIVTTLSLLIAWTDSTGAQTVTPIDAQSQLVGSYVLPPIPFQAASGSVVAVTATATVASDARISVSIKAI
jgi:hypothetical protein